MLKTSAASAIRAVAPLSAFANPFEPPQPLSQTAFQYEIFELILTGPSAGNPFLDSRVEATFTLGNRTISVEGFYDGRTTYKVRFIPDIPGQWKFKCRLELLIDAAERNLHPALRNLHRQIEDLTSRQAISGSPLLST